MWFSSVFTAIHDLSVVSADCLMAYAVAGTDLVLTMCYCMLLHVAFLYIFLFLLVMGMVYTTKLDLIHYTIYLLDSMAHHIMHQPEVYRCTAGFTTHAARWSRQPASGLWHMLVMVPCAHELLHHSAKALAISMHRTA